MRRSFNDLTGRTYHRLSVVKFSHFDKHRFSCWLCRCECGKSVVTRSLSLRSGHTKSCGCFKTKHGLGSTKTYYSWADMKRRCMQTHHYQYPQYGGRGIKVCKRWLKFANFYADMGIRPEGTSLDRINGKKGYYKANCRWATSREQIINRTLTRWIKFRKQRKCLADWALPLNISASALSWRIDKGKWPLKYALTLKANPDRKIMDRKGNLLI